MNAFDDDEFDEDDEAYDDDELDDESDAETITCSGCGADVYEDAPQCPHCGHYLTTPTSPWLGRPWWWIVLGATGAVMFALSSC